MLANSGISPGSLRSPAVLDIPLVTGLLLALNVAISMYAFGEFKAGRASERFLFEPARVMRGENLQGLVLSNFSHADGGHLTFNMFTLFFFGPLVEAQLGPAGMLGVYLASAVGSTLLTLECHKKDPDYRALGASGAISGILFAAIVLVPTMGVSLILIPFAIPAPIFAVLYIGGSIMASKQRLGNIGHEAHIGGAVTGFIVAALLLPEGLGRLFSALRGLVS
ncbi:MAG: membrane associated rhomboid family serine protease [Pseudohongiellaceae bacterium]|jgi:membrane associated rhomboid family serine protease